MPLQISGIAMFLLRTLPFECKSVAISADGGINAYLSRLETFCGQNNILNASGGARARAAVPAWRLLLLLLTTALPAQTLARPGWAGSGMTLEPWWTHSVFYAVDPHRYASATGLPPADIRGITAHLDYIRSLGVDAVTLTHFTAGAEQTTLDPALGTFEDFDDLVREASRDSLRLLVELDATALSEDALLAAARPWLAHGAAGIILRSSAATKSRDLRGIRQLLRSFRGQRVLIADANGAGSREDFPDLLLNSGLSTAGGSLEGLRAALNQRLGPSATLSLSAPASTQTPGTAIPLATLLLATRANAQLAAGEEIGLPATSATMPWGKRQDPGGSKLPQVPAGPFADVATQELDAGSLLNWYRRLIDLHHGNNTLRSGTMDVLDHDQQGAIVWVARRGTASFANPAIVVICNLTAKPLTLSLTDDMARLHLRGNFLRTVLRSSPGMGSMSLNAVTLPPFGAYLGELLY